ncbi:DMT family transporter [Acinetobacter pollinis]|uniref:Multidrug efflux SMR transporter n=1 Tax=Acinetobacter pollinis TaxID=2605270 RepID=A0ABU6DRI3_9GAMM|nr:multidrug efflux SMR transporter [Acinetobacter pollinis]MBF7690699.1 multidrug efflux SMR transporter [Acinetobacter pollinis]MBF7692376.1 multidrug efflux SMR transporter [Acinetobacter pollinis]MBF7698258.1 multidrug efflux SMR transporter [Acinetobacter pollinis]MBF7701029.1 multidrug efflux SMR transporter [Acinetobacter pollinis]MEB5475488.1 multidrug efflux SMR transporter [Acinetobacter pollinis]
MRTFIVSNMGYLYLFGIIVVDVLMMFFLTQANGFTNYKATALSLVFYAITFVFAGMALKYLPTGIVYALWGGLGTIGCVVVAHFFLDQKLTFPAYIGIGFIVVGVMILEFFSETSN